MNFNIISEYFKEGTLDSKIRKHKIFSEIQVKYVCRQLLNAVKYLNENNLVHTDISPDIIYIKDIINEGKHELYTLFDLLKIFHFNILIKTLIKVGQNKSETLGTHGLP